MRPLVPFAFVALVVGYTLACGDANAGVSDGGTPDAAPSGARAADLQSSPSRPGGPPTYLTLTGPAKRFCSGIWVSGRVREEALYNSVLWTDEQVRDYESGRLAFAVDDERRIVTASYGGVEARARHFGDQGCVILPDHTDGVFFTPREVTSALPDVASTPWPMGDALPDQPMADDVVS